MVTFKIYKNEYTPGRKYCSLFKWKMSMRAMLWLKDDYPETSSFLMERADDSWLLNVGINNMDPANRIVRSMPGEVEIIEN
jgi:hypothetical protein